MDAFGVDWSSGWAGNITAEAVGLVGGLLITYVVADRVVKWRLQQERRPLRDRLNVSLRSALRMLDVSWGLSLGLWKPGELAHPSDDLHSRIGAELEGYSSGNFQELVARLDGVQGRTLTMLAQEMVDDGREVTRAADRYPNVVGADTELHGLIGDLESSVSGIETMLAGLPTLARGGQEDVGRVALVALCNGAFGQASKLRTFVGDPKS